MKEAVKLVTLKPSAPPSFEEAQNRRQKARAAGMNPDYWYAVEWEKNVKRGEVKEVIFWKQSIAIFRGQDGKLSAMANGPSWPTAPSSASALATSARC